MQEVGLPTMGYALIGVTTLVLAYVTIMDTQTITDKKASDVSFPTFPTLASIAALNPFSKPVEPVEPASVLPEQSNEESPEQSIEDKPVTSGLFGGRKKRRSTRRKKDKMKKQKKRTRGQSI